MPRQLKVTPNDGPEISVVAPMQNEELCVRGFCSRVDSVLRSLTDSYEIIVVSDGSTDATGEILNELSQSYPRLFPLHLARRRGQCGAIEAGFQHSRGQYVVMM